MATIGLTRLLPKPKHTLTVTRDETATATTGITAALGATQLAGPRVIPPYLRRQNFVPRVVQDFEDGGSFPEIHVAQYPLNMGKKDSTGNSTALVTVDVGADGKVQYDAIVQQGTNRNKTVYSKLGDVKEREADEQKLNKPTPEEEAAVAEATKNKLSALIGNKVLAARPTQVGATQKEAEPAYIKYTPNPDAPGYNPAASQRVIELVEAQVDPLEPPKHKHKKVPRGAPEDPVPVLHSPPRKLSVQDQEMWKIPPCVSNWKNPRGYTIPLDKRMAADGRGLQDVTINPKFAQQAQALYIAEQQAREELHLKQKLNQKLAKKEREQKEQELREMAARSRMQRSGVQDMEERLAASNSSYEPPPSSSGGSRSSPPPPSRGGGGDGLSEEERVAMEQRERLRAERRRELEMDMRKQNMKGALRKSKMDRDGERDVSEKIALGMHTGSAKLTGEEMYDARLFNQGGGVGGGFGAEDDYNLYNKGLFDKGVGSSIYRPRVDDGPSEADADAEFQKLRTTDKFRPDKGFAGADYGGKAQNRSAPVQFEKDGGGGGRSREEGSRHRDREREKEEDFFELDQFISDAKKGKKNPLSHIGSKGGMVGGTGSREDLDGGGSKRQRIDFSESTRR